MWGIEMATVNGPELIVTEPILRGGFVKMTP
jgi:hypothetical protein